MRRLLVIAREVWESSNDGRGDGMKVNQIYGCCSCLKGKCGYLTPRQTS